jgi:hypothetical protein
MKKNNIFCILDLELKEDISMKYFIDDIFINGKIGGRCIETLFMHNYQELETANVISIGVNTSNNSNVLYFATGNKINLGLKFNIDKILLKNEFIEIISGESSNRNIKFWLMGAYPEIDKFSIFI